MRSSGRGPGRALVAAGALAAAAVAAWVLSGGSEGLRAALEGSEAGVRRVLASTRGGELQVGPGGGSLRLQRLRYLDPLVAAEGDRAEVTAVADADGVLTWRGASIAVAYLGRERLALVRCPGAGWCLDGAPTPRLAALLATLVRRAQAFDDGDAEAYLSLVDDGYRSPEGGRAELLRRLRADLRARPRARLRPLGWQARIERDSAEVGEDYEITLGEGPPRRLRARLALREEGGRWRFTGGL